jgi:c-di-GMP-binding flagellar brake protein YcgR
MAESYSGDERRKFKRIKVSFTLVYSIDSSLSESMMIQGHNAIDALMVDLNQEGMAILTENDIALGTIIILKFTLIDFSEDSEAGTNNMDMLAKVVSNTKINEGEYRVGLYFTQISRENKVRIAEFIRNKEP